VNEDLNYNEQQQNPVNSLIPPQPLPSIILPPPTLSSSHGPSTQFGPSHQFPLLQMPSSIVPLMSTQSPNYSAIPWRIPLSLVHPRELGYECTNPVRKIYNKFFNY
jgi:hypothetical protein